MKLHEYRNITTGGLLSYEQPLEESVVRSKKQVDACRKHYDTYNNKFTWMNLNEIAKLDLPNKIKNDAKLSLTILGGILVLASYINHNDVVICKQDKNRTPYTRKELQQLLKMKDRTFAKFLKVAREYEFIYDENKVFKFTRNYFFVGKNDTPRYFARGYRRGIRGMFTSNLGLDKIGFIFLVLPYLGYDDCRLEFDEDTALKQGDLERQLGLSKATVRKYLNTEFLYKSNQTSKGAIVKLFARDINQDGFFLNPLVIRRNAGLKGTINICELHPSFVVRNKDKIMH